MGDRKPTALLSGINRGANLAEDITYSGTAAAAMEGALLGMRAIALSQVFTIGGEAHWATARRFAPEILAACDLRLAAGQFRQRQLSRLCRPTPSAEPGSRRKDAACRARSFRSAESTSGRSPTTGSSSLTRSGELEAGTDLLAIAENAISITPMQMDLTANAFRHYLDRNFREG